MARPVEFDREEVLQAAMEAFWEQGFRDTSMQDLVRATGLHPGSLYGAFGSKQGLYTAALRRYFQRSNEAMNALLANDPSPVRAVHRYLAVQFDELLDHRGCMLVNAAMEFADGDAEISAEIQLMFRTQESRLAQTLAQARDSGELPRDCDCAGLARFLFCGLHGLHVAARSQLSQAALSDALQRLLGPLDAESQRAATSARPPALMN